MIGHSVFGFVIGWYAARAAFGAATSFGSASAWRLLTSFAFVLTAVVACIATSFAFGGRTAAYASAGGLIGGGVVWWWMAQAALGQRRR